MIYSLIENAGKVDTTIALSGCLADFDNHHKSTLEITLPTGLITLSKSEYLNTGKVYDSGKVFFIVATKSFCSKQIKKLLLQYACDKIDVRVERLKSLKMQYEKLIAA